MTTTAQTAEEQFRLVYEGITAVAARCDGAQTLDRKGFDGQDTHFGRRIAAVSFEEWTPAVKVEAARIASKYRSQIEAYTGVDVATLDVVREAAGLSTVHEARNDARRYERQARGNELKAERKATLLADGTIQLTWHKKDPDCFDALLNEVRRLPGRRWTGVANVVDLTPEAVDFIERHAIDASFDLTVAKAEAVAAVEAKVEQPDITLEGNRVRISFPYDPAKVAAVRSLPGRAYDGYSKTNTADLCAEVLAFADKYGLKVAADARQAIEALAGAANAAQDRAAILRQVSRQADPTALPEAFVAEVLAKCPKARAL